MLNEETPVALSIRLGLRGTLPHTDRRVSDRLSMEADQNDIHERVREGLALHAHGLHTRSRLEVVRGHAVILLDTADEEVLRDVAMGIEW